MVNINNMLHLFTDTDIVLAFLKILKFLLFSGSYLMLSAAG